MTANEASIPDHVPEPGESSIPELEADETIPPRPEEEIADLLRAEPDVQDHADRRAADVSAAIVLYLKRYPGKNDAEFRIVVDDQRIREEALAIVDEAQRVPIEWGDKTLIEIGDDVREVMRQRHPELSDAALDKLANYFTYLVK